VTDLRAWWASLPRKGWEHEAACRDMDRGPFFTNNPGFVKTVCEHCPVADDCLVFVLRTEPEERAMRHGVFGGMSPRERHRLARLLRGAGVALHFDGHERVKVGETP
jgi:hypothetical protein